MTDRQWLVKRVAAGPGEPWTGYVGGEPLPVPAGHLALVGDNPEVSFDSRQMGPFPLTRVLGMAREHRNS